MKLRTFLCGFALGGASVMFLAMSGAQQDPAGQDPAAMDQMWQQAMEKYCTPSSEHELFKKYEGSWDCTGEFWMAPGTEPMTSTMSSNYSTMYDGRYLFLEVSGNVMGEDFMGGGVSGFDRMKGKYVSCWIDNMSTAIMTSEGAKDGDKLVYKGMMPDVMSGKYVESKSVEYFKDDNTLIMEMYGPGPDGKMFMNMRLTCTRKVS
jgi:hypothetical protein